MPCRSDYNDYPGVGMVNRSTHDMVVRAACTLSECISELISDYEGVDGSDSEEMLSIMSGYISPSRAKEAVLWITNHRKMDEERKLKLKESALQKLTDEEKEALGL